MKEKMKLILNVKDMIMGIIIILHSMEIISIDFAFILQENL